MANLTLTIIINMIICVCAMIGFIMGAQTYFKPRQPLYAQMTTIALGCAALGRLYNVVVIVCNESFPQTFNIGMLAVIGCFLFLFSANHNQIDSLCDMSDKKNVKFRYIALIAPAIPAIASIVILFFSKENLVLRISCVAELVAIMLASYYNCKHLLIHDIEYGFIDSVRGYNLIILILGMLYTAEITLQVFGEFKVKSFIYLFMSICLLRIIPVLKKGMEKWKGIKKWKTV